jgi:hypothetical protein
MVWLCDHLFVDCNHHAGPQQLVQVGVPREKKCDSDVAFQFLSVFSLGAAYTLRLSGSGKVLRSASEFCAHGLFSWFHNFDEAGVEEVLVVPFHALNGRVDDFDGGAVLLEDAVADALDGGLTSAGVADDASLADVLAACFKLRLDEYDDFTVPGLVWSAEGSEDRGNDKGSRDEGDIHCEEGRGWMRGSEEFAGCEKAGVSALAEGDARVVAKLLGDLTIAGVYGQDRSCPVLQHAVGEAAGRGSDVDAGEAGEIDRPMGEGVLELEAAAADVFEVGAEEADRGSGGDGGAGFVDALLVDEDAASEDEGLGAFAGDGVAMVDEKFVEANLFRAGLFEALFCWVRHSLSGTQPSRESWLYLFMVARPARE